MIKNRRFEPWEKHVGKTVEIRTGEYEGRIGTVIGGAGDCADVQFESAKIVRVRLPHLQLYLPTYEPESVPADAV